MTTPRLKRGFDAVAAALGLLVLSPFLAGLMVAVKLTSPGRAVYRCRRVGRGGREFDLFKFRTMVEGADQLGPRVTCSSDERVTGVGRLLRRSKLDELPQLLNVLKGDMSLVGPRPEDPHYVGFYTPEQRRVLAVRPGITSEVTLHFRDEEKILDGQSPEEHYVQRVLPAKLAMELECLERASFRGDLKILFQTVRAILR